MGTMNIFLPDDLRNFVEEQVAQGGYETSSEYVRELIRRDQERLKMRALVLEGAQSLPNGETDDKYFKALRQRAASSPSS